MQPGGADPGRHQDEEERGPHQAPAGNQISSSHRPHTQQPLIAAPSGHSGPEYRTAMSYTTRVRRPGSNTIPPLRSATDEVSHGSATAAAATLDADPPTGLLPANL